MLLGIFLAAPAARSENSASPATITLIASGFSKPVDIASAPGEAKRLYVVEEEGRVIALNDGARIEDPFLDLVGDEQKKIKLFNIAFHPAYPTNHRLFLSYAVERADKLRFIVAEYNAASGRASDEKLLIDEEQPYKEPKGGGIVFGDDGSLYIGVGDGGGKSDPKGLAQKPSSIFGKMLRLNVDDVPEGKNYGIPADNPYSSNSKGLKEIHASGFHNPVKLVLDPVSKRIIAGDRGASSYEELNILRAGGNYGWSIFEGPLCLRLKFECLDAGLEKPFWYYARDLGSSVVPGVFYSGSAHPQWQGLFVYGDSVSGSIWGLKSSTPPSSTLLIRTNLRLSSLGQDQSGEIYAADYANGDIYRLSPAPAEEKQVKKAVSEAP